MGENVINLIVTFGLRNGGAYKSPAEFLRGRAQSSTHLSSSASSGRIYSAVGITSERRSTCRQTDFHLFFNLRFV